MTNHFSIGHGLQRAPSLEIAVRSPGIWQCVYEVGETIGKTRHIVLQHKFVPVLSHLKHTYKNSKMNHNIIDSIKKGPITSIKKN